MSTQLQDLPHQAILGGGLTPRTVTATTTGSAVDLLAGDGKCFAIQQVGTVGGTTPALAGKLQESADNNTWTDIAGAAFASVSTTDNVQAIAFDRTMRYVRYIGTVTGTSPSFPLAVIVSEQKKEI
jgi:hypothetical protein